MCFCGQDINNGIMGLCIIRNGSLTGMQYRDVTLYIIAYPFVG